MLELLKLPEDRLRYAVRRELAERESADVSQGLDKWLKTMKADDSEAIHQRLEGLWMYQTHNVVKEDLLKELLTCSEPRARAAANACLCCVTGAIQFGDAALLLKERLKDDSPRVRLEAVRAASYFQAADIQEAVLEVLDKPMDPDLEYTLDETMRLFENQ